MEKVRQAPVGNEEEDDARYVYSSKTPPLHIDNQHGSNRFYMEVSAQPFVAKPWIYPCDRSHTAWKTSRVYSLTGSGQRGQRQTRGYIENHSEEWALSRSMYLHPLLRLRQSLSA
ncbi:hypothetical protein RRG08_015360 [Elysia crispata]|uniref:Uncharacterized protein n=1 Tax=Elysia crispata TaxID=231223 RepID=A0AAE1A838_9GAST|nr:hypothetical protein RRG08_015360 [Elysia crispata]